MTLAYVLLGALVVGAIAFGVAALITGSDAGLAPAEPDGVAVPLPTDRPLSEPDFRPLRFDTALRGYRMAQVDTALRRAAYDIGYKEELVAVLEAEVAALREGRHEEADALRRARLAALGPGAAGNADAPRAQADPQGGAEPDGGVGPDGGVAPDGGAEPAAAAGTDGGVAPAAAAGTDGPVDLVKLPSPAQPPADSTVGGGGRSGEES